MKWVACHPPPFNPVVLQLVPPKSAPPPQTVCGKICGPPRLSVAEYVVPPDYQWQPYLVLPYLQALRRLSFNPIVSFNEEILGETSIVITNEPQQFLWEVYGLVLDIEKESLPAHLQECHICIKALTPSSVQDYIPYDVSLCSAIY